MFAPEVCAPLALGPFLIRLAGAAAIVGGGYLIWKAVDGSDDSDPADYTDKVGKVAEKLGRSVEEINKAIHKVKPKMGRGGGRKNPDVAINPKTGDVRPKTEAGGLGDSIGNIFDHLK